MRTVHLRRALLLFAIVLGTAALVASLSRPVDDRAERKQPTEREQAREPGPPTVSAPPASGPAEPVTIDAARDELARVRVRRATTVEVEVEEPGNVQIPGLGLGAPADPLTPARFELFPSREAEHEVVFTPASGGPGEPAGRLVVTSAG